MYYWAWGGKYIGHRSGNCLYSKTGTPLGIFYGEELYDFSGKYIGEIKGRDRIIVNKSSKHKRKGSSCKPCGSCGSSCCNYIGNIMLAGYEDFAVD